MVLDYTNYTVPTLNKFDLRSNSITIFGILTIDQLLIY